MGSPLALLSSGDSYELDTSETSISGMEYVCIYHSSMAINMTEVSASVAEFNISGTQLVTGKTYNYEEESTKEVTIKVADASGVEYKETKTIAINDINDTPVISGTAGTSLDEDTAYSFTPTVSDEDSSDIFSYSVNNIPSWATINATTGELSGTPENSDVGTYSNIEITVTDTANASAKLAAFNIDTIALERATSFSSGFSGHVQNTF